MLVEDVENVLVHRRIKLCHGMWVVAVSVQLVGDRKVAERFLQDKGPRLSDHSGGAFGRELQHRFDLPPRCLVANADWRVQYQPAAAGQGAIVDNIAIDNR